MHHHEQHRKDYVWHIVVMMWLANAGECFVFEITLKMNTAWRLAICDFQLLYSFPADEMPLKKHAWYKCQGLFIFHVVYVRHMLLAKLHGLWCFENKLLPPGRLTWNLQITHLERKIIFQTIIFRFHVNLPEWYNYILNPTCPDHETKFRDDRNFASRRFVNTTIKRSAVMHLGSSKWIGKSLSAYYVYICLIHIYICFQNIYIFKYVFIFEYVDVTFMWYIYNYIYTVTVCIYYCLCKWTTCLWIQTYMSQVVCRPPPRYGPCGLLRTS